MRPFEQKADSVLLGAATMLSVAGLIALIGLARKTSSGIAIASVSIYGATLVIAYLCSGLYEARIGSAKWIARFQALDHCTIFLLIAGTFTPLCALALAGDDGWWLLAAVWLIAASGIGIRVFWLRRPYRYALGLYLLQGWIGVPWVPVLLRTAGMGTLVLIAAGGVAYTVGIGFYLWRGFRYGTLVWHLFVVVGSVCHFLAIALYLLPWYAHTTGL